MNRLITSFVVLLLTAGVLFSQETPNTADSVAKENVEFPIDGDSGLPAWSNDVASIQVLVDRRGETVRAYQNSMPTGQQGKLGFLYNYVPSLRPYKIDPQSKMFSVDIVLEDLNREDRAKLQEVLTQIYSMPQPSGFQLSPLPLSAYSIGLDVNGRVVQIAKSGQYSGQTIPVNTEINDPYIISMLETRPDLVVVDVTLYNKFQVTNIESVSGSVTTALKNEALETVLGNKPQEGADLFVTRDLRQDIKSHLITKIDLQLSSAPTARMEEYIQQLDKLFELPEVTAEELEDAVDANIYYRPEQFRKEVTPAFVRGIVRTLEESGTFRNVLDKAWNELNELKKTHNTVENFHKELRDRTISGRVDGSGFLGAFSFGGSAKDWSQMTDQEKREFTDFYNKIQNEGSNKEELFREWSKAITGKINFEEVTAKDFDLYRISQSNLQRTISMVISILDRKAPIDIPSTYRIRLGSGVMVPPPVPVGTVAAYFGEIAPDGWLLCDGKTKLDEPQYEELRKLVGDAVPDLRGYFLRGFDPEGKVDPEGKTRKLGVAQADMLKAHRHTGNTGSNGAHVHTGGSLIKSAVESETEWRGKYEATPKGFDNDNWNDRRYSPTGEPNIRRVYPMNQSASHTHSITSEGGAETRPQNKAVNYIIRY